MPKRLLVIDGDDQGHFFVVVDGGTMTIGGKAADIVLEHLHISRIHCEVEVDEDVVVVGEAESTTGGSGGAPSVRQELRAGQAVHVGLSHLRLEAAQAPEPLSVFSDDEIPRIADDVPATPSAPAAAAPSPQATTLKKLVVIDGGDKGRFFSLPETGITTIGKSSKHADIALHDLYVARVHCEVQSKDDRVFVTHVEGQNGTLINGQRITEPQELRVGEVLRVGNSQLRLEIFVPEDKSAAARKPDDDAEDAELVEVEPVADADVEVVEEIEVIDGEPAVTTSGQAVCLPHAPVDQLLQLENQMFGHYHVGPLLGRGQCGLVFRAQNTKTNQLVALKVLSPDFPKNDAELQRFVQALKVVPNFHHAHLVTLHGAGRSGPYCWIAKEYIEGDSLARLLQRLNAGNNGFDWTHACRVAWHLGHALALCHKRRVIHGNITPRNILIEKSNRTTRLADLMLRQALAGSHLYTVIRKKKLLAELPYLAPEQTDPKATLDQCTDIYALGAVVYHLLTGQAPFSGATPTQVLAQVREGKLARPSQFQRGIPAPFEAIVLKMMARRPEDRFQSADEVVACIEPIAKAVAL